MNYEIHEGVLPADVLFIHGNLASNDWWRPALNAWKEKSLASGRPTPGRAILAEWRGCGRSPAPSSEAELRPEFLANDYIELLQRLRSTRVHVVGHSTGGLIALFAMAAEPPLFERAVLLNSVTHRGVEFTPEAIHAFVRMSQDRATCEAVMATTIHGVDVRDPGFQALVDSAFGVAQLIWTGVPKALGAVDASWALAKARQPTLVLHGALDPILPASGSAAMARAMANAAFHEVQGHGHSLNLEDPELFVRLADAHLFGIGPEVWREASPGTGLERSAAQADLN